MINTKFVEFIKSVIRHFDVSFTCEYAPATTDQIHALYVSLYENPTISLFSYSSLHFR